MIAGEEDIRYVLLSLETNFRAGIEARDGTRSMRREAGPGPSLQGRWIMTVQHQAVAEVSL